MQAPDAALAARWRVDAERQRQDRKWGEQNHDDHRWLAILVEEVGELAQAINDDDAGGPHAGALTGNVTSEKPPAARLRAIPPARSLAEIEADPDAWRLPRPQRDPLTGQLIPPRDAAGHAVWRVRVYGADERTCAMCGETFTPRVVRNSHGAPMEIGYCERCGVENKDAAGAPVAAPNVRTLAYLQDGEAEIVTMAP